MTSSLRSELTTEPAIVRIDEGCPPRNGSKAGSSLVRKPHFAAKPKGKTLSTRFAAVVRWLHIYISLLGFGALFFFAVTGITLNHPTWFGADAQRTTTFEGQLDRAKLHLTPLTTPVAQGRTDEGNEAASPEELERQIDKLAVVEHFRNTHRVRGAVTEFRVDEFECMVLFKGPGYAADFTINRESGKYTATQTVMGAIAIINDLHKGRDSGQIWSWVIDLSAIVAVIVSITGIVLIFYIRRKRLSGILTAVFGTILLVVVYVLWVP